MTTVTVDCVAVSVAVVMFWLRHMFENTAWGVRLPGPGLVTPMCRARYIFEILVGYCCGFAHNAFNVLLDVASPFFSDVCTKLLRANPTVHESACGFVLLFGGAVSSLRALAVWQHLAPQVSASRAYGSS